MKKNYLIIGGTSGIGSCIADQLVANGNVVSITGRNTAKGASHPFFQLDVLDESPVMPEISDLDGLVYCPGTINLKPFRALKDEDYLKDLHVNLLGAVKVLRHYTGKMNQGASVVLFSTVAVGTGMPFHASIAAAKGAVEGLGRSLAAELAPKIRVNVIAPSLTNTSLAENLISSESKLKLATDRHPLKSIGDANDIASLAVYLLSPSSKFITGQILHADGGMSSIR